MNWIPWAALVSGLAAIMISVAGIWASRQRSASEVEIITGLRTEVEKLTNSDRVLRARVRAVEKMNGEFLTALEEYHRGAKLNIKQLRGAGLTPLWEPSKATWRNGNGNGDKESKG